MLIISGLMWTCLAMAWIHGLTLRYPAPFIGMPGKMSGTLAAFYLLTHSFPKSWNKEAAFRCEAALGDRQESTSRRQKRYLFAVFMATEGIHMAYFALELSFVWVPPSYQWLLALLLPVMQV